MRPDPTTKPTFKPKPNPPAPQNHRIFDPWNSASTGHQRAEGPYVSDVPWNEVRAQKLGQQFRSGDCQHEAPSRGASKLAFDGRPGSESPPSTGNNASGGEWRLVSEEEAKRNQLGVRDIRSFMGVSKRKAGDELQDKGGSEKKVKTRDEVAGAGTKRQPVAGSQTQSQSVDSDATPPSTTDAGSEDSALLSKPNPKLFAGTCIFLNGSTLPQISDHKLKRLLVAHGAQISISMARKTVTHVIVGQPNGPSGCTSSTIGAGGGLAASKLQQEIARGGWKGVKVVGVDWYVLPAHLFSCGRTKAERIRTLESIKAGRRLAESRFGVLQVASKGQKSVASMFGSR